MSFRLTALLLPALLCMLPAQAAVYKCRQADGSTAYQGTPCAADAQTQAPLKLETGTAQTPAPKPGASAPQTGSALPKSKCAEGELSIDFRDMPVAATLQVIADYSGNKLVFEQRVEGSGAFRYPCTPWREVLQDIANRHRLSAKVDAGRIVIAPAGAQPGGKNK